MNPFAFPYGILHRIPFFGGDSFRSFLQSKIEKIALQRFISLLDALGSEWPGYRTHFFHFGGFYHLKTGVPAFHQPSPIA
jgi:hypothetical protein